MHGGHCPTSAGLDVGGGVGRAVAHAEGSGLGRAVGSGLGALPGTAVGPADGGADGRALCDVAVQLALDYRYVYGEEISAEELLEGLQALLALSLVPLP